MIPAPQISLCDAALFVGTALVAFPTIRALPKFIKLVNARRLQFQDGGIQNSLNYVRLELRRHIVTFSMWDFVFVVLGLLLFLLAHGVRAVGLA